MRTHLLCSLPLTIVAFATLVSSGCHREDVPGASPKLVQVRVVQAAGSIDPLKYSVSLQAVDQRTFSFKVGGYIQDLATRDNGSGGHRVLEPGDQVSEGEILATLRQTDFDDQVAAANGQVGQAAAAFERAERDYQRAVRLHDGAAMTGAQFETYRSARDGAKGALESAQAGWSQAKRLREDSKCIAPFDGVVVRRLVERGDLVAPGAPAFIVADLKVMKGVFGLPDNALSAVKIGDQIQLESRVLQRTFTSRVTSVGPTADPVARLFTVELTFSNPDLLLKPGMVATAYVPVHTATIEGVSVPLELVTHHSTEIGAFAVFTVEQQGGELTVHERKVQVGPISGNTLTITQGLRAGEAIVAYGLSGLHDGEKVVVVP